MKMKMEINQYLKKPYARILVPADDGTYFAEILEFPGCFAQGDTPNQAMENLDKVAIDWIQSAIELGQQIPGPNLNVSYSGRIALRLPKSIHRRSAMLAEHDQTSLNQFFLSAIATRVGAEDFYERLLRRIENRIMPVAQTIIIMTQESLQSWDEPPERVESLPFMVSNLIEGNVGEYKLEGINNA
jgi:antitoxin HicB